MSTTSTHRLSGWKRAVVAATALAATAPVLGQASRPTLFVANRLPMSTTETSYGVLTVFTVNPDGTLQLVETHQIGKDSNSMNISPSGELLVVAGGQTGTIGDELLIYRVGANSRLTQIFRGTVPGSAMGIAWLNERFFAVTQTGTGTSYLRVYEFFEEPGLLIRRDVKTGGTFMHDLAYRAPHPFLYSEAGFGAGPTLTRWAFDPQFGYLTEIETIPTFDYALDPVITPDGAWLYAGGGSGIFASGCDSCINAFDITDPEIILPHFFNPMFTPHDSPAHLEVTDNGHLLVGHGADAVIASFAIGPDGLLLDTGHTFDVGSQGDIGMMAALGNWLFVTDRYTYPDNVIGLYSFTINDDGSFTQNGPVVDTQGRGLDAGMEVWPGTGEPFCICEFDADAAQVNVFDLLAYLDGWFVQAAAADVDGAPGVNVFDLLAFLDCWFPASSGTPCS